MRFEDVAEVRLVIEPRRRRDCRKGPVGLGQFLAGGFNALAANIFADGATIALSESPSQMPDMHPGRLRQGRQGNILSETIVEVVAHPSKPGGCRARGLAGGHAPRFNQNFQDTGLNGELGGRVGRAEFFVKAEPAASRRASQKLARVVKDSQLFDDSGQSLRWYFYREVASAKRRDMPGVDFAIRMKNHVSGRAITHAAAIAFHILSIQHDTEMRLGMHVLRDARTRSETAFGEPKSRHFADMNPTAVEFPCG